MDYCTNSKIFNNPSPDAIYVLPIMFKVMESQPSGYTHKSAKNQNSSYHVFLNITVIHNEKF